MDLVSPPIHSHLHQYRTYQTNQSKLGRAFCNDSADTIQNNKEQANDSFIKKLTTFSGVPWFDGQPKASRDGYFSVRWYCRLQIKMLNPEEPDEFFVLKKERIRMAEMIMKCPHIIYFERESVCKQGYF